MLLLLKNKGIYCRVFGGLGNQLFQYATAYALAKRLKVPLYIDKKWFVEEHNATNRSYELDNFKIKFDGYCEAPSLLKYHCEKWSALVKKRCLTELKIGPYNSSFMSMKAPAILNGFFQSEKYFRKYRDEIVKMYQPVEPLSSESLKVQNTIKNSESVSVHIRRGDFLTNENTANVHGVCSINYYRRAIDYIKKMVNSPCFFFFSDDIEWVKDVFNDVKHSSFIRGNEGRSAWQDFTLLVGCKHNIIANSSFSWWGAWLGGNADKLVIAPGKWFRNSCCDTADLLPENWLKF